MATLQREEPKRKVLVAPSSHDTNMRSLFLAGIAATISIGAHAVLLLLILNLDSGPVKANHGDVVSAPIIEKPQEKAKDRGETKPNDRNREPEIDFTNPVIGPDLPKKPNDTPPVLEDFPEPPTKPKTPPGLEEVPGTPAMKLPPPPGPGIGSEETVPTIPGIGDGIGVGIPRLGGEFRGRTLGETRAKLLDRDGGNMVSEAMVAKGLQFLANHQNRDGHWSMHQFDQDARKQVKKANDEIAYVYAKDKSDPRTNRNNDIAGTAFGLLPFLAAGHTHYPVKDSKFDYSKNVKAGLAYLMKQQNKDGYYGGDAYAHALATIALCEAYGLTADNTFKQSAQRAIQYIESAQHEAGGWRYSPRTAGDTSVTAWYLMALKSGQMAGLSVKAETLKRVEKYLDSCESAKKGGYGYMPGTGETMSMTAAGLLCRQYLGVTPLNPGLLQGVERLAASPPSRNTNIYYLYYATQVMHHMGGEAWKKWNLGPDGDGKGGIRDTLIGLMDKGDKNPDTEGSWVLTGGDGRLMSTSLALLTLEVYYRHLPLYRRDVDKVKEAK